ncbi:MAG: cobalamin-dependent protein, partial [Nitrososphaeraceae archaeon]|nr:cobalamin-dependent protein [Nitrososphaeraceae archaeon]
MKVCLIHPSPYDSDLSFAGSSWPPTGILYIASILEKESINVSILDHAATNLDLQEIARWIKREDPDILGFSVLTSNSRTAVEIARKGKESNPNVITVLGNMHATFNAERILKKYHMIDIIVRGEGEYTTLELVNCLEQNGNLNQVKGITFRLNDRIIQTSERPLENNIDQFPFPNRKLLNFEYHSTISGVIVSPKKFTSMLSSRGCSFSCRFCGC